MYIELIGSTTAILGLLGTGIVGCCCSQQQQQQQMTVTTDNESGTKRVCPNCGIENPRSANHCGDCGYDFNINSNQ